MSDIIESILLLKMSIDFLNTFDEDLFPNFEATEIICSYIIETYVPILSSYIYGKISFSKIGNKFAFLELVKLKKLKRNW